MAMESWNTNKSLELYGVPNWGDGYFGINPVGNVTVRPDRNGHEMDLYHLVAALEERGIKPPVLLRFDGIMRDRVKRLAQAFASAIQEMEYRGVYKGVYPIKVNQQRHVVDTLRQAGKATMLGLEVGSKPELIAVLAVHDTKDALLLCNGYKDSEYIEFALHARKLGRRAVIIIEQYYELNQILEIAERLGMEAEIGIRMKPSNKGSGRWESCSGDHAKFGLTYPEIMLALERLQAVGKTDWLKLLHFHISSQVPSIASIKRALREASRTYVELAKLCPSMCLFDVGGGLGVDYDGSRTNSASSMNYTPEEYARDIVDAIGSACNSHNIPHPDIVSESGRALSAHHSVLITEVFGTAWAPESFSQLPPPPSKHTVLQNLCTMFEELSVKNCHETLNDALALKEEVLARFNQSDMNLVERAYAEVVLWNILMRIRNFSANLRYIPEDLENAIEQMRDVYFCNFSVFQSAPDAWAIDQLFPIVPIHRLAENPSVEASLADVSCDSEGRIDKFIDLKDIKSYVRLHPLRPPAPYYVGIFLVGAYQEVLGDLHNLFGDTHAVHVDLVNGEQDTPKIELKHLIEGDCVREVLTYLEYDSNELLEKVRVTTERHLQSGNLAYEQAGQIQRRYREALEGYTYLNSSRS